MAARKATDYVARQLVEDIYKFSVKKQTGVSLKHMMDFGAFPTQKNLLLSAQFLHKELPIRLAHRVVELENLPFGLSSKHHVLQVKRIMHRNVHVSLSWISCTHLWNFIDHTFYLWNSFVICIYNSLISLAYAINW